MMGEVISYLLGKMKIERKRLKEKLQKEGLELDIPPDFDAKFDKEFEDLITRNEDSINKIFNLSRDKNKDGSQE